MLFDEDYYLKINEARWAVGKRMIAQLPAVRTCIDAGCGPGWFTQRLLALGLDVTAFDGRDANLLAGRDRVPGAEFVVADVEQADLNKRLKPADIVFCFGLLYHLENPFAAVRNLANLTQRFLLIETQVIPSEEPLFYLSAEGENETQGLRYHALIPSLPALAKMLYLAGFTHVFRYTGDVAHEDFADTAERYRRRHILLASKEPLQGLTMLKQEPLPRTGKVSFAQKFEARKLS